MPLLTLAEVEALVQNRTPESSTLDYKADFTNDAEKAKKELAKDVAAFANSQGGTIIIGIEQDRETGIPLYPLAGVPAHITERQLTAEWIEQTLNQTIAQRVAFTVRPLELADPNRCIIVIDVPVSPRAPHMVTYQQDNRYYRRYFKRHQYESLPAEEYEVREMFQRSLRFTDEVSALLNARGYRDRRSDQFGANELTVNLAVNDKNNSTKAFVSFVAIPNILVPDSVNFTAEPIMRWFQANRNNEHPSLATRIVPNAMRRTFDGLLCSDATTGPDDPSLQKWDAVMLLEQTGYVEYGTTRFTIMAEDGTEYVRLTTTLAYFWTFIAFVGALYREAGVTGSFRVFLNIVNAGETRLTNFGKGWSDGRFIVDRHRPHPCLDQHLQVLHEFSNADFDDVAIEVLIRQMDLRIEHAYNHSDDPRSYHHSNHGNVPAGQHGRFAISEVYRVCY